MNYLASNLMLAVSIDLNLGTLAFIGGVICLGLAVLMGLTATIGKGAAFLGLILLLGGHFISGGTSSPAPGPQPGPYYPPTPGPQPQPGPYNPAPPVPQPQTFAVSVQQAFQQDGGTKDDAALLAALFGQMSDTLAFDGQQPQPRIANGNNLGTSFARLQQYRMLQNPTSIGQRFPRLEALVAAEINRLGLNGAWDDPVRKRADAVLMFRAVSDALRSLP